MLGLNRRYLAVVAAALAVCTVAACSSSSKSTSTSSGASAGSSASNLPATITIPSLVDLTGSSAFAGIAGETGTQLALSEINSQHYLGANTTLAITTKDTAGSAQTAASDFTEAAADKSIPAVLGTITSAQSQAVAPIAEQTKLPTVFTQSGSTGTVLGPDTFRLTAPGTSYYGTVTKPWIKSKNVKTATVIYDAQNPTLAQLAQTTVPQMAKDDGFAIASSAAVQTATVDFSAAVSKVGSDKSDLVILLLVGPQYSTVINQLKQAGYSGNILAHSAAGTGNLKTAGQAAAGVVYPDDFFYKQTAPSSVKFVAAYQAKFNNAIPTNFAAARYDALWFIARALKIAGTTDRPAVQKAMDEVAKTGFDGAMGKLTFDDRDLRVPGVLVEWDGSQEVLAPTS